MELDYEVIHQTGVKVQVAYALSRLSTNRANVNDVGDEIPEVFIPQRCRKVNPHIPCCYQDRDNTTVDVEPYSTWTSLADDVKLPTIVNLEFSRN